MDSIIQTILGMALSAAVTYVIGVKMQLQALKKGVQALLYDRMMQKYRHAIKEGITTNEEKKEFEALYVPYHTLGTNGIMTDKRKRFIELPEREDDI